MITKRSIRVPIYKYGLTIIIFDNWYDLEGHIPDYVFDENQSVKWNREQVEKHNNDINTRKKYRQSMIYQELHQIQVATVQYIQSELSPHISEEQAGKLYEKLYSEFESGLFQGKLDTLLDAILEVFS